MVLLNNENGKKSFDQQLLTYMKKQKTGEDARLLIEKEIKLHNLEIRDLVDSEGLTLLHHAALLNCTIVAQYLVDEGFEVEVRDNRGHTPLMLAVNKCSQKTTGVLLKANANIQVLDADGEPLATTVLQSGDSRMIKIFLNHIQTICSDDCHKMARKFKELECPLSVPISLKRIDVIKAMLDIGYPANPRCNYDSDDDDDADSDDYNYRFEDPALHVAVSEGNFEIIKLLVQHGGDVNAKNWHKETPLFKYTDADNFNRPEILQFFIDKGADLMEENDGGQVLMFKLLDTVDLQGVQILAPYIDFTVNDSSEKTALHYLAENYYDGVIELVRNKNFDVDARDCDGNTPLMIASKQNLLENVKFFLEHKADVNLTNDKGETALTLAFTSDLQEEDDMVKVVQLLLLNGANAQQIFKGSKTIFDSKFQLGLNNLFKPVLVSLVLTEASGVQILERVRNKIVTNIELKKSFDLYKKQYERLKSIKVYESVSLQHILYESQERIALYKRNPRFMPAFRHLMKYKKPNVNPYFLKVLWRRLNTATVIMN